MPVVAVVPLNHLYLEVDQPQHPVATVAEVLVDGTMDRHLLILLFLAQLILAVAVEDQPVTITEQMVVPVS